MTPGAVSPLRQQLGQCLQVAAVLAVTALLAQLGQGTVARLFFTAAGLAIAAAAMARSPWLLVTATLWFWTLTPFARRLIDQAAGFDPTNLILATPNLMAALMLRDLLFGPSLGRLQGTAPALPLLAGVLYGMAVSFVGGAILPGAVAAADWLIPLLYLFHVVLHADRIAEAERHLRVFLPLNLLVVAPYAVLQYVAPQPWDVAWVLDSGMISSIGLPLPYVIRVFGTLNAPGVLAFWLAMVLLLGLGLRSGVMLLLMPLACYVLLLTMVRAALLIVLVGIAAMLLLGRAAQLRATLAILLPALLSVALAGAMLVAADPELTTRIAERFATLGDLGADESAQARSTLYSAAPEVIAAHPLGLGIGALGRGAVAISSDDLVVVDAGPLAVYLALGWVAGSVYLLGAVVVVVQALRGAWASRDPLALALAAAAAAGVSSLAFTNLLGFIGAVTWLCAGWSIALGRAAAAQDGRCGPRPGAAALRPLGQASAP